MGDTQSNDPALAQELKTAWHRLVDVLVPLRPGLHAYCRKLTRNLWDAEDLVQDTLVRAFGQWGVSYPPIRDPRAYLLRTATNVWIDAIRRRETVANAPPDATATTVPAASVEMAAHVRQASAHALQHLSPQETAAIVLKEAFDMTLEEIAEVLATSTGAVKAALHRGRERLEKAQAGTPTTRPPASRALIERFIDRFNARDVEGLVALTREGTTAENVGNSYHSGHGPHGLPHFFTKVVHGHSEWPPETQVEKSRLQLVDFEGEPIILSIAARKGREALTAVFRFEELDGAISRVRAYGFCPDTIRAVGEALGMRVLTGLYRAPTPAPGMEWP